MKLQFEKIEPEADSSFRIIHHTQAVPGLLALPSHRRPEYEIVYIPAGTGHRQAGTIVSRYEAGEIVFIGPNLPHLNFRIEDF